MFLVDSVGNYEIHALEKEDAPIALNILKPVVCTLDLKAAERLRQFRNLEAYVNDSIKRHMTIVLKYKGDVVAACVLGNYSRPTIIYIHVLNPINIGSAVLFDYILNQVFENKKVFLHAKDNSFKSVATYVSGDMFKVNKDIAPKMASICKIYKESFNG